MCVHRDRAWLVDGHQENAVGNLRWEQALSLFSRILLKLSEEFERIDDDGKESNTGKLF